MIVFFWFIDMIIPIGMIVVGVIYKKHQPKKINVTTGYRSKRSMASQENWDYAQRQFSKMWLYMGPFLGSAIIVDKIWAWTSPEYLSMIHFGVSIIIMLLPIIYIEQQLKKKNI